SLRLNAWSPLSVGTVVASSTLADPSGLFGALSAVTTNNADINLKSAGLAVNQPIAAGTGIVRLVETGAVSQDATNGAITASALRAGERRGGDGERWGKAAETEE